MTATETTAEADRENEADAARSLALLYALPGAAFGLAFWLLADAAEDLTAPLVGLLIAVMTAPLAWTLTTEPRDRVAPAVFAAVLSAGLGGLGALAWLGFGEEALGRITPSILLIAYVVTPFFRTRRRARPAGHGSWHYPALFADAWNLPVVLFVASAFAGAAYGVLWLLAAMFDLIGIDALTRLLREGFVSLPLTGALTASGIGVTRRSERVLLSLRGVLFGLLRVIAPVFAVGTALFSVALLFRFAETFGDGWGPVVLLVTAVTAALFFVNAVVQDEDSDAGTPLMAGAARLQCLVLPVLAGLAAYTLWVRIDRFGLSPDKILAGLIVLVALAYALTYAVAGVSGRWKILRVGNVVLAAGLVTITAFTLTPLFATRQWSVADQLAKLEAGRITPEAFDLVAFAYELGEPGQAALDRLRAEGGPAIRARIAEVLDETDGRWEAARAQRAGEDAPSLAAAIEASTLRTRPQGAALPDSVAGVVRQRMRYADGEGGGGEFVVILEADGLAGTGHVLERQGTEVRLHSVTYRAAVASDEPALPGERVRPSGPFNVRTFETEAAAASMMDAAASGGAIGRGTVTVEAPVIGGVLFPPAERVVYRGGVTTSSSGPNAPGLLPLEKD